MSRKIVEKNFRIKYMWQKWYKIYVIPKNQIIGQNFIYYWWTIGQVD